MTVSPDIFDRDYVRLDKDLDKGDWKKAFGFGFGWPEPAKSKRQNRLAGGGVPLVKHG